MNQDNTPVIEGVRESYVELIDSMGDDLTVCNSARVSFNKTSEYTYEHREDEEGGYSEAILKDTDEKLIKYLATHNHWTPFANVQLQFRIKMPIAIARQWYKHMIGFNRNEVSRRYVSYDPEFFMPDIFRGKPLDGAKQGSGYPIKKAYEDKLKRSYLTHMRNCATLYKSMVEDFSVAPEQARMVLPQCMMTEFIETGSLAAYARLVKLRTDKGAQKEIQEYAQLVSKEIEKICPVSWGYLIGE